MTYKKVVLLLLVLVSYVFAIAQVENDSSGKIWIQGFVFDEMCNPIEGAFVRLYEGGLVKAGTQTDKYGYYKVSYLDPGRFYIEARTISYKCVRKPTGYLGPASLTTIEFEMKYGSDCFPGGGHKVL